MTACDKCGKQTVVTVQIKQHNEGESSSYGAEQGRPYRWTSSEEWCPRCIVAGAQQ